MPWLWGALGIYSIAFLIYAETWAFTWDESYHLLAAQLIDAGRTPYIDFCFPQTLLHTYLTAGWMRIAGQSWHTAHAIEAVFAIGAVVLIADYAFRRFPDGWRPGAALTVGAATGLSLLVFRYSSVAQPYAICLLALCAAFRMSVLAVERERPFTAAAAGFFAGCATGSSLLTLAAMPVFLIWMLVCNRAGSRWRKFFAWTIAAVPPFAPVIALFISAPRQTWFNVFTYHTHYRTLYWPNTTLHDLEILTAWLDSSQGVLLGMLAVAGLYFVWKRSHWPREQKCEFYLCAWLAAAIALEVGRAHPTFAQYFLLTVPFLAVLAAVGMYETLLLVKAGTLSETRPSAIRPAFWPVAVFAVLMALALGRSIYDEKEADNWSVYERLAAKVAEVTPPGAPLMAQEPIYFLLRRLPPPGLELAYTHKLSLSPSDARLFHILSDADVRREVQAGMFATAYACDSGEAEKYGLSAEYRQSAELETCNIFWDRKR